MRAHLVFEKLQEDLNLDNKYEKNISDMLKILDKKEKVLFLTTSNRGDWAIKESNEEPKSTKLAKLLQDYLGKSKCTLIEVPKLNIYDCEGNVSHDDGNSCGVKKALLKDSKKNPSGYHRCWSSINEKDDELWKISKALFESDTVVFFGAVRWGQMSVYYQKLIERLTWLESRHSSLGESNVLKDINAGIVVIGQNWNGKQVLDTQKEVLKFFGFDVIDKLCWNWQYTDNYKDESLTSYKKAFKKFSTQILDIFKKIESV